MAVPVQLGVIPLYILMQKYGWTGHLGAVIVPALVILLNLKETEAIATSLAALVPPVGFLGAWQYYRAGAINVRYAALVALGLFVGAYFGAKITTSLPPDVVRRLYGAFLLIMAARMLLAGK